MSYQCCRCRGWFSLLKDIEESNNMCKTCYRKYYNELYRRKKLFQECEDYDRTRCYSNNKKDS